MDKYHHYSNDELLNYLKEYYIKYKIIPTCKDFDMDNHYPSVNTYKRKFGSWKNSLKLAGLRKEKDKRTDFSKDELIIILQRYYHEFGKSPTIRDFYNNDNYPTPAPFRRVFGNWKNALIAADIFKYRKDNSSNIFDRRKLSEEELLDYINKYISQYGHIPSSYDMSCAEGYPHASTYIHKFGSFNNALRLLNLTPRYNHDDKTDDELVSDIVNLYHQLGRTPTVYDIADSNFCSSVGTYNRRFESLYSIFDIAHIPYNKRTKFYSNEDIISIWNDIYTILKRIPSVEEIEDYKINIYSSIYWRWDSYSNFLKEIGKYDEYNKNIYITRNGTKCLSSLEYAFARILERYNLDFIKDEPYSNYIPKFNRKFTFDFVIDYQDTNYFVEIFGIKNNDFYDERKSVKIKLCNDYNLTLIDLYPEDFKGKKQEELYNLLLEKIQVVQISA